MLRAVKFSANATEAKAKLGGAEFKLAVTAALDDPTNMDSAVATSKLVDEELAPPAANNDNIMKSCSTKDRRCDVITAKSDNASLCKAGNMAEETSFDAIETILKEPVALYKNINNGWVPLDTKGKRSTFHLYRRDVDQTYSFVISHAGRERAVCALKGTSFISQDNRTICFAVPMNDERTTQTSNGKISDQFAIKANAERINYLMDTLRVKQHLANGKIEAVPNGSKSVDKLVVEISARLIMWVDGEFERLTWKKGTVRIYHNEPSGFILVCKRANTVIGICHLHGLESVKKVGSYVEMKSVDSRRIILQLTDSETAEKLAFTLNSYIASLDDEDDSSVELDDCYELLYQTKAMPVLVTPKKLHDEDRFFFIPADSHAPNLYAKQLDEGWLQIRRRPSGGHRMDLLNLSWDIREDTRIAVQEFAIQCDHSSYMLSFIKILCRENVTGEVYMLRVREDKVLELYHELGKIGLVDAD